MNKQISILGTGWLGLPLAQAFIDQNYTVKGSTTSISKLDSLQKEGISPFLVSLTESATKGSINAFLEESEILIINVPPGLRRNPDSNFVAKIQNLIPHIENSSIKNVLFISSTSVYADRLDYPVITTESLPDASHNAGKQLIAAELLLQNTISFKTTVLRFAGLFDERRHPATMLSKRKGIKNPLAPVNLIHREDCIHIINRIITTNSWNHIFNASSPNHPAKAAYYGAVCKKMELPIPDYDYDTISKGKIIDASTMEKVLEYKFIKDLISR
ncbi:epimerase [Aquimarina addita]|uniref:Epimerase n=1 Tax=Aquimarina addita TaxID=870485 RepID=A0ABP7XC16_9FLAO